MLGRVIRWAREGSIATFTVLCFASAPLPAQAGWFDDVKDAVGGLGALLDPSHEIGKFALGSIMVGGGLAVIAGADLAVAAGAAAIVGTAITGGGILLVAAGAGLAIWGGYQLWKAFRGNDADGRTPPVRERPGNGGSSDPGRPGRIDPGRTSPGGETGTNPGTIGGGSSTTPGDNGPRTRHPDLQPNRPNAGDDGMIPSNGTVGGRARGAGWMRP